MMATRKPARKKSFSAGKEVRAMARERLGTVKPVQVITPKSERKPKHRKPAAADDEGISA